MYIAGCFFGIAQPGAFSLFNVPPFASISWIMVLLSCSITLTLTYTTSTFWNLAVMFSRQPENNIAMNINITTCPYLMVFTIVTVSYNPYGLYVGVKG